MNDYDDGDDDGPSPPLLPRPRRTVERSWQLTPASQASATASASASHSIITRTRIDPSQSQSQSWTSQSGSSLGVGPSRPVLQIAPASPSRSASQTTALTRTLPNANSSQHISLSQVVGPRVLVSPAKQAPSSRPALAVSQPQGQSSNSSRTSSGYSILTIVPSSQRTVAPAPALPPLPLPTAQSSATSATPNRPIGNAPTSTSVTHPQPRPMVVGQSAHSSGIVRPSSSIAGSQASTQVRLVAPVPGSSPIVRLSQPTPPLTCAASTASTTTSSTNVARGSVQMLLPPTGKSCK